MVSVNIELVVFKLHYFKFTVGRAKLTTISMSSDRQPETFSYF